MINSLSNYALSIACTAFIMNLIQMILPSGKNRNYILFVCTMIITIVLVRPIIELVNNEINISNIFTQNQEKYLEIKEKNYNNSSNEKIVNEYKKNIEKGIIQRLEDVGYNVKYIECKYNDKTLEPDYLYLEIEHQDGEIQPVKIEVNGGITELKEELTISELIEIKKILREEYGINEVEVIKWKKY